MKTLPVVGTVVGLALGLLSSGMDLLIWTSMGRPVVLVRQGWERVHIGIGIFCGPAVGMVYGAVLCGTVSPEGFRRRRASIISGIVLFATAAYAAGAFLSIKAMNIFPWLAAHAAVLLAMVLIASLGAGSPRASSERE